MESVEAVVESTDVEDELTTGVVVVAVVVVSVAAVSDRVEVLQPARARPARRSVNKIEFFIGGLSCAPTDRALAPRFPRRGDWFPAGVSRDRQGTREYGTSNGFARKIGRWPGAARP